MICTCIRSGNFNQVTQLLCLTAVVFHHSLRSNTVNLMCDRPLLFACSKWKPGQPDNWGHGHEIGEDCAGLIHEGLWNDFFCEDLISYICEKEMETCKSTSLSFFLSKCQFASSSKDIFLRGALMLILSIFSLQ